MKYFVFTALIGLLSLNSFAQKDCYLEITQDATRSSRMFYLSPNEVTEYESLGEEQAAMVMDILLKRETSCSYNDVKREAGISCYKLRTGMTCEILTTIGYFILHRSSYGNFDHSVIYTRWD
jgi:hypothetical protein